MQSDGNFCRITVDGGIYLTTAKNRKLKPCLNTVNSGNRWFWYPPHRLIYCLRTNGCSVLFTRAFVWDTLSRRRLHQHFTRTWPGLCVGSCQSGGGAHTSWRDRRAEHIRLFSARRSRHNSRAPSLCIHTPTCGPHYALEIYR